MARVKPNEAAAAQVLELLVASFKADAQVKASSLESTKAPLMASHEVDAM